MAKNIIAKRKTSKPAKAAKRATATPLDRNDPRIRALADDLIRETIQKADLAIAAHHQQKEQDEKEAAEKRKAAREAEARSKPKLSVAKRLELAQRAGFEFETLARRIREQVAQMVRVETHDQEVTINVYLSRMQMLGDALADIGTPEDEFDQDVAALAGLFTYFPATADA